MQTAITPESMIGQRERIQTWIKEGLKNLSFYVRQNIEKVCILWSAYFIELVDKEFKSTTPVLVLNEIKTQF